MKNKFYIKTILLILLFIAVPPYSETLPIAVVVQMKGKVFILREKKEFKAEKHMPLYLNDKIKTLNSSYVEILFDCGVTLRVEENTLFEIKNFIVEFSETPKKSVSILLKVNTGAVLTNTDVNKDKYRLNSLHIITPTTVASVRGTVFYVKVGDDNTTDIAVFQGKVECNLGSFEEEELDTLFEEEIQQEMRKKIIIEENKQTTISSDLSSIAVVDLSFNIMEYKRTVVKNFLNNSENYRKNFEKFEKERNEWIKKHRDEFKRDTEKRKKEFMKEFGIEEEQLKKKRR